MSPSDTQPATVAVADPPTWRRAIRVGLTTWALALCAYLCVAALVVGSWPSRLNAPLPHGWIEPFALYAHYDAGHFLRIAMHGYFSRGPTDTNAAFFPGYPGLCRLLLAGMGMTHPSTDQALVTFAVVAWLSSAVASVLLWRYVCESVSARAATVSVIALYLTPYSHFIIASYSESLFLAAALAAWLLGSRGRWPAAALFAGAAVAIRINGLFLVAGLLVMLVQHSRRDGWRRVGGRGAVLTLAVVPALAYIWWLRERTGRWDAWIRAQKLGWNRSSAWPWQTLANSVHRLYTTTANRPMHFQAIMELVFAGLCVVVVAGLLRRRMWPESAYVGLASLSLLTSSFYQSVPRSMVIAFPVFALIGAAWTHSPRARLGLGLLGLGSVALLAINVVLFSRGYLAG